MYSENIPYLDKELVLLSEIGANQSISQRKLSQKFGLSLGTVNILIKKMFRQGLVKMEAIPTNRIVYMLTPAGIAEKAFKTLRYIKENCSVIEDTKQRIIRNIRQLDATYDFLYVVRAKDELLDLLEQSVLESQDLHLVQKIIYLSDPSMLHQYRFKKSGRSIVVYFPDGPDPDLPEKLNMYAPSMTRINLLELL